MQELASVCGMEDGGRRERVWGGAGGLAERSCGLLWARQGRGAGPGCSARPPLPWPWSRAAANTLALTLGTLPSGRTSGPVKGALVTESTLGFTKSILLNWLRSSSTFLLPCFRCLLLFPAFPPFATLLLISALTLGFFPSALINGGLSKGLRTGLSVAWSETSTELVSSTDPPDPAFPRPPCTVQYASCNAM